MWFLVTMRTKPAGIFLCLRENLYAYLPSKESKRIFTTANVYCGSFKTSEIHCKLCVWCISFLLLALFFCKLIFYDCFSVKKKRLGNLWGKKRPKALSCLRWFFFWHTGKFSESSPIFYVINTNMLTTAPLYSFVAVYNLSNIVFEARTMSFSGTTRFSVA